MKKWYRWLGWLLPMGAALLLTAASLLVLAQPAWAGGWAVVTLDRLPGEIQVGQEVSLGFTIRQHGVRPMTTDYARAVLVHQESGKSLEVKADPEGADGHYVARFSLPEAGTWSLGIASGLAPEIQAMPNLTVISGAPANAAVPRLPATVQAGLLGLAGLGLVLGLTGLKRSAPAGRPLARLGLGAALVLAGLVAIAALLPGQARSESGADLANQGAQVFMAKGCPVCHLHSGLDPAYRPLGAMTAPELTNYTNSPEFLRAWLKNPQAMRPNTAMPNLELSSEEIEALVQFLQ